MATNTPTLQAILLSKDYTMKTKGLYVLIDTLCRNKSGITAAELEAAAGCTRKTLRRYLAPLVAAGEVGVSRAQGKGQNVWITLLGSEQTDVAATLNVIQMRLALARKRRQEPGERESLGEALMHEWLTLIIDSHEYSDRARPGFLQNPATGMAFEYDRWYPQLKTAFEFHGRQHFETTQRFNDPEQVKRQLYNDLIKIGLSHRNGIAIVEVRAHHLKFESMQNLIPANLPRHQLDGQQPIIHFLNSESARYRRSARVES